MNGFDYQMVIGGWLFQAVKTGAGTIALEVSEPNEKYEGMTIPEKIEFWRLVREQADRVIDVLEESARVEGQA